MLQTVRVHSVYSSVSQSITNMNKANKMCSSFHVHQRTMTMIVLCAMAAPHHQHYCTTTCTTNKPPTCYDSMSILASLASRSRKRIGHSACATQPPNMCASAAPAHLMTASPYALRRVGTRPCHLHSTSTVPSCPKPVTPLKAYPTIPRSELYPRPTAHRLPSTSTSPDTNRRHCWKEIL
jgi:hypothetical protein